MDTLFQALSTLRSRYRTTDEFRTAWVAYDSQDDIRLDSPFQALVKACVKLASTVSPHHDTILAHAKPLLDGLWERHELRQWMVDTAKSVLAKSNEDRLRGIGNSYVVGHLTAADMVGLWRFREVTDTWISKDFEKKSILEEILSTAGNGHPIDLDGVIDSHTTLEEVVDFFTFLPATDRIRWLTVCNLISASHSPNDFGVLEVFERLYNEHARQFPLEIEVTNCLISNDTTVTYSPRDNIQRPFNPQSDAMILAYSSKLRQWPKIIAAGEGLDSTCLLPLQELVQQLCALNCVPDGVFFPESSTPRARDIDTAWLAQRLVEVLHDTGIQATQFLTMPIRISDPYDTESILEVQLSSIGTSKCHENMVSSLRLGSLLQKVLFADGLFEGGVNLLNVDNINSGLAKSGSFGSLYRNIINNASYNLAEQREIIFGDQNYDKDWRNEPVEHMDNEILDSLPRLQSDFLSDIGPVVGNTLYSIGRDNQSRMTCKNRNRSDAFIAMVIDGEIKVYRNKTPFDFARRLIPLEEVGAFGVHAKIAPQQPGARLSSDEVVAALLAGAYGPIPGRWALNKIHELGLAASNARATYLGENARREGGKVDPRVQLGSNVFNNIALVLSGKSVYYSTNGTTMRKVVDKGLYFHIDEDEIPVDEKGKLCRVLLSKPVV